MTELKKKAHKSWENDTTVSGASMPNKIYEAGYIAGATETTKELQEEITILKHNKKTVAHLSSCISDVQEKKIAELELEIKKLTQHLEPQLMTDLLKQVREEVEQEQRIAEFKAQIEKMKCCLSTWYEYENERYTPHINIDELLTETQQFIS